MTRPNTRSNARSARNVVRVMFVAVLLTGCTMRTLLYRNSPLLISEALDDRFDLSGAQEDAAEARLQALLEWHRSTELAGLSSDLSRVDELIEPNPSAAIAERDTEAVKVFFSALLNRRLNLQQRLWPDLANFLRGLNPDQHKSYLKNQEERWEKWSKRLQMTAEDYLEDRIDRLNDQLEPWFGRLTDAQEKLVSQFVADQRPTDALQLELSKASTRWLFDRLAQSPQPDTAVLTLLDEAFAMRQGRNLEEKQLIKNRMEKYQTLVTALLRSSTAKQRQHLKQEIRSLKEDVDELSSAPIKGSSERR